MLRPLLIVAGILLVLVFGVYVYQFFGKSDGLRSPEELSRDALEAATPAAREQAALDLARSGDRGRQHLRDVLDKSKAPEVKAAVIQGLAGVRDFDSMPRLIQNLEDTSQRVRASANAAVVEILGADFYFRADDPPEKRAAAIQAIKREYERFKQKPPPMYRKR